MRGEVSGADRFGTTRHCDAGRGSAVRAEPRRSRWQDLHPGCGDRVAATASLHGDLCALEDRAGGAAGTADVVGGRRLLLHRDGLTGDRIYREAPRTDARDCSGDHHPLHDAARVPASGSKRTESIWPADPRGHDGLRYRNRVGSRARPTHRHADDRESENARGDPCNGRAPKDLPDAAGARRAVSRRRGVPAGRRVPRRRRVPARRVARTRSRLAQCRRLGRRPRSSRRSRLRSSLRVTRRRSSGPFIRTAFLGGPFRRLRHFVHDSHLATTSCGIALRPMRNT